MFLVRFFIRQAGLRLKLTVFFALLIVLVSLVLSITSMSIFSRKIEEKNTRYISDITYQTVNNIEFITGSLQEITFEILSSSLVQRDLRILNRQDTAPSQHLISAENIERFLSMYTLYNNDIVSLSVFTLDGHEIVSRPLPMEPTKSLFTPEEVFAAKGSAIWGLVQDDSHEICVARAVIDLSTQKPIGYINMIVRQRFIGNVMNDITISNANGSYLLNSSGLVISSNLPDKVGDEMVNLTGMGDDWIKFEQDIDGEPSFIFQSKRVDNGWTLVTVIPQNELRREALWFYFTIACVDLLVFIVVIVVVWAMVGRIMSPFNQLCRNMEEVGRGHFEKSEILDTNDEMGMLSRSYNKMVDNIELLIEQVYELEISSQQSELEFLKMQINPHFLYNTLDTISWMARIDCHGDIANVSTALGNLLRASLKQDHSITIAHEIENIHNYLLIQKYRFGSKLEWNLKIDDALMGYYIPSFILQPLVENAIIHGLEPKMDKGRLEIEISLNADHLRFVIGDDGVGMSDEFIECFYAQATDTGDQTCIGMRNVNRRLRIYYGKSVFLQIHTSENKGTRVSFQVPISKCARQPHELT